MQNLMRCVLNERPELREIPDLRADDPSAEEDLHNAQEKRLFRHRFGV